MVPNLAKIGQAVTFKKYLFIAVSLIYLPKTLIRNKKAFLHKIC